MLCDRPAHILLLPCKQHDVNWHCCTSNKTGVPSLQPLTQSRLKRKCSTRGTVLHLRKDFFFWATQPALLWVNQTHILKDFKHLLDFLFYFAFLCNASNRSPLMGAHKDIRISMQSFHTTRTDIRLYT